MLLLMRSELRLSRWRKESLGDQTVVSALIGDVQMTFTGTSLPASPESADPWRCVALHAPMAAGSDLELRDLPPVSPKFLATTELNSRLATSQGDNTWMR
jgi:hypothetical protein